MSYYLVVIVMSTNLNDPDFKKLTAVSKIIDYDKIEDIFKNKE